MKNSKQYVIDDLSIHESWRLFKIMAEIVDGFDGMGDMGPAVSIFGSARINDENDPLYVKAEQVSKGLAEAGYTVITGGGPGLMEAANKGAKEAGGESVGLHIHLPMEQHSNPYLTLKLDFNYFFVRKLMFVKYAYAYVALPGGFGTMDELFEALVLIQTKRIKSFPIVLLGKDYWTGLVDWMKEKMIPQFIHGDDLFRFEILDTPEEAVQYIKKHVIV